MKQEQIILLRGVMPSGKNSIPKMAVLRQHLEEAGFERVRTYIQSGNILLLSDLPRELLSQRIHDLIKERIGADLAALVFLPEELQAWVDSLPFADDLDPSRIFFTMTMACPTADRYKRSPRRLGAKKRPFTSPSAVPTYTPPRAIRIPVSPTMLWSATSV